MIRYRAAVFLCTILLVQTAVAQQTPRPGDLVRIVRLKLSAGDLQSGIAAVEDYRRASGDDAEYLDAVGWLARGSQMLGKSELAQQYVGELRREIPKETAELLVPLGAAIEVQGRLLAAREGRGSAIRYLEEELARAQAVPLRARIRKNINLLSLEGGAAPAVAGADLVSARQVSLAAVHGKPALLYFWAWGCGDCRAQSASLARVWEKYRSRGLAMLTVTRLAGSIHEKPASPDEETAEIAKTWKELYGAPADVPVIVDTETMVRWGVSATPTFALVDRKGIVRLYTPTRLSEAELSRRIEELLAETD